MPSNLRACIYVLIALFAGYMLCKSLFREQQSVIGRMFVGWVTIVVLIFIIPSAPVYFIFLGFLLVCIAPKDPVQRFQFCCALLPAVPMNIMWRMSLPGIETVMWFDHAKIISMSLLLPLILQPAKPDPSLAKDSDYIMSRKIFTWFLMYMVITIVLSWRDSNITSAVRTTLETFFSPLLFLLVANRMCRDRENVNGVLFAILISGVFVALISCVEQVTRWKLFNEVSRSFIYWEHFSQHVRDIRWGMMRTPATMGPIPLGYLMSLCIIISIYFSGLAKRGDVSYKGHWMVTTLLFVGLVFSGSRGAWMITLFMLGLMLLYSERFKIFRNLVFVLSIVAVFSTSAILSYLAASDPYGTFQYRIDLFYNSLEVIKDNFFFGDTDFRSHPALQASRQGEGIIDVVNVYLGIALNYGVPALVLLSIVIYRVVRGLIKKRAEQELLGVNPDFEWQLRVLLVMIAGGFVMVVTVSFVDRISHYLWLTLVFGICFLSVRAGEQSSNEIFKQK